MRKIAVVTGASSGIGREFALQISERYRTIEEIWIIARRTDRLEELKSEIEGMRVRILGYDLTKDEDIYKYKQLLAKENPAIRVLVNAAGYGVMGDFAEIPEEDNVGMIDLNCKALTAMTYASLPYMAYPSNIINVASSAGFMPQPGFAIYAASKSMVLSFSRALNRELKGEGITVTAVCPGPVNTEFFERAEAVTQTKAFKKLFRVEAFDVVWKALNDAYYGFDVSVYGPAMKAFNVAAKVIPHGAIIRFLK